MQKVVMLSMRFETHEKHHHPSSPIFVEPGHIASPTRPTSNQTTDLTYYYLFILESDVFQIV